MRCDGDVEEFDGLRLMGWARGAWWADEQRERAREEKAETA
jgi:hypothetical protein